RCRLPPRAAARGRDPGLFRGHGRLRLRRPLLRLRRARRARSDAGRRCRRPRAIMASCAAPPREDETGVAMGRQYRVAVVGATGTVGETMLSILAERGFPVAELVALASAASAGSTVAFGDDEVVVRELAGFDPAGVDIAL